MNFDVLDAKTPIFGKRVLEASAGTGKTFAIEHLVVRLLIEENEDKRVQLSQILIVTFTQAAARELKARIRSNIDKALIMLKEDLPAIHYLAEIQDKPRAVERLQEALLSYDEANIYTIHGFCLRSMKEFAFESESLLDQEEDVSKFYPYVKRFLRGIDSSLIHPNQLNILLKNESEIEGVSKKLIEALAEAKELPWRKIWEEIADRLEKKNPFHSLKSNLIKDDFNSLSALHKKIKAKEEDLLEETELLAEMATLRACSEDLLWKLAVLGCKTAQFFSMENRKKKYAPPLLNYPGFFDWVREEIAPLIQKLTDPELICSNLAFHLQEKLSKEEGFFTHDEILRKMHLSVLKRDFVQKLKSKYRAVIIDEFQDTDPIQWQIFSTIFLSPTPVDVFYIVGDPKQSIYGFRNADVYTYLDAVSLIGKENTYMLNTNYRSVSTLTTALNTLFQKEEWLYLPKNLNYLPFHPVQSGVEEKMSLGDEKASLHFFTAEGSAVSDRWPSKEVELKYLFPFIAKEILSLLEKKVPFSEFAVLVRDRYQAKDLEEYLLRLEIPSQRKRSSLLSESSVISFLKDFFKAVYEPEDESKVKIALSGPYIGYTLAEISSMEENLPVEPFYALRTTLQKEGIAHFFSSFFEVSWKEMVVERAAKEPSLYQDTLELIEHLLEYSQKKGSTSKRWDEVLQSFEKEDQEEKKKQFYSQENAVQILTMHMSKGLEFSFVFSLGLACRSSSEDEEGEAEKLRQLYVAMTRAKKRLYVPLVFDRGKRALKRGEASPIELFLGKILKQDPYTQKLFKEQTYQLLEPYFSQGLMSFTDLLPTEMKSENAHSILASDPLSPPPSIPPLSKSLVLSFSALKQEPEEKDRVVSQDNLPKGADFGIFIHKVLEILLSKESLDVEEVLRREILYYPFKEFEEEMISLVRQALYTPLKEGLILAHIPREDRQVEVEFFSPYKNRGEEHYLKGFIDVVFYHEGKYYLLDWKTNTLDSYSEGSLQKVLEVENYTLQAAIYTDALERFLKKVDPRPFAECFGGMFYIFLRGLKEGRGIIHFYPDLQLLKDVHL
jgi:exodeoxyribonuclease V beta subunit